MSLTGLPAISLAGGLAVLAAGGTVRFWRRGGRYRLPRRVAGLAVTELLVVVTIGLVANRVGDFYPSWAALTGDLGTVTTPAAPPPGRLDGGLATARAGLTWTPSGDLDWRFAQPAVLVPPAGYELRSDREFPVMVVLATADEAAPIRALAGRMPDVVTLIVTPTAASSAAALATLPGRLAHDARVTRSGWAIVADTRFAKLAQGWLAGTADQFRGVTVIDRRDAAATLASVAGRLPAPLAAPLRPPS